MQRVFLNLLFLLILPGLCLAKVSVLDEVWKAISFLEKIN